MKINSRKTLIDRLINTYGCVLLSRAQASDALLKSLSWLDERKEYSLTPVYIKIGEKNTKVQYLVSDIADYVLQVMTKEDVMSKEISYLFYSQFNRLILSRNLTAKALGISKSELDVRQKKDTRLICLKSGGNNARVEYEVSALSIYVMDLRIKVVV